MKQQLTRLVVLAALCCAAGWFAAPPVVAGIVAVPMVEFTAEERTLIANNPALAELGERSPELLRTALDMIAAVLADPSNTRGGLEGLDEGDVRILGQNPALLQVWRSSPEASADLLLLIRTAAGGGKPQK